LEELGSQQRAISGINISAGDLWEDVEGQSYEMIWYGAGDLKIDSSGIMVAKDNLDSQELVVRALSM
jgi:hypothetical protein